MITPSPTPRSLLPLMPYLLARSETEPARGLRVGLPDRRRHPLAELLVEFAQLVEGLPPLLAVHVQRRLERARRHLKPRAIDRAFRWYMTDRGFHGRAASVNALDDPLEDAHVLPVSGPEEEALRIAPEPVHPEDLRRILQAGPDRQPMGEVVGHVVTAERDHRHRVAPHDAHLPGDRGGRLGSHGRAQEDPVIPVERLEDE